jgi:hypothetical protein
MNINTRMRMSNGWIGPCTYKLPQNWAWKPFILHAISELYMPTKRRYLQCDQCFSSMPQKTLLTMSLLLFI